MLESRPQQKRQVEAVVATQLADPGAIAMREAEVQPPVSYEESAEQVTRALNPHHNLPANIILGRD